MSDERYTYFMIPFASVPATPGYPVWYSRWTTERMNLTWTTERPAADTGNLPIWVIGMVENTKPPVDATLVWLAVKCIPPPPMALASPPSLTDFNARFAQVLTARGD